MIPQRTAREALRLLRLLAGILPCVRDDDQTCLTAKVPVPDRCATCDAHAFLARVARPRRHP